MDSKILKLSYIVLFGLIVLIGINGLLDFYIHPRYIIFTVFFCFIGLLIVIVARSNSFMSSNLSLSIVMLTALVALGFPPATLSSRQALFREGEQTYNTNEVEFSSYDLQSRDLSRYDISDWTNLLSTDPDPQTIIGSTVNVVGFYIISDGNPGIARFKVSCCAIDATPLVLFIDDTDLNVDQWYEITGIMDYNESTDQFIVVVDSANDVPEPEDPYVF